VSIDWTVMDVGFRSVMVYYDPCVSYGLSLILTMPMVKHSSLASRCLNVSFT